MSQPPKDRRSGSERRISPATVREAYADRRYNQGRRAADARWQRHTTDAAPVEPRDRILKVRFSTTDYDRLCHFAHTANVPLSSIIEYIISHTRLDTD